MLWLPNTGSNFNAIIGRDYLVAEYAAFAGPVDGEWTLSLRDTQRGGRGHYIGATLFVVDDSCSPSCSGTAPCGNDHCGGSCGACSAGDRCTTSGQCVACTPICAAGQICGDDGCGGTCGTCETELFCTEAQSCNGSPFLTEMYGLCSVGSHPCDSDFIPCSSSAGCDEGRASCEPDDGFCMSGLACFEEGDVDTDNPCRECAPPLDTRRWVNDDTNICDDDNPCTERDECSMGICSGAIVVCENDNPCTDDFCDPATGCSFTNNHAVCDDTDLCTVGDLCSGGVCLSGAPSLACDDEDVCTEDSCDSDMGCLFELIECDDLDECTVDSCDPFSGCLNDIVDCDDHDACTDDSCDPTFGCIQDDIDCDDGDDCTLETCDEQLGCLRESLECDDDNSCTDDSCDPSTGCIHENNSNPCDDDDPCTADDICRDGLCNAGEERCQDRIEESHNGCSCNLAGLPGDNAYSSALRALVTGLL